MHDAHVVLCRELATQECWDAGKEATGVRPRWVDFASMSIAEIDAETAHFWDSVEQDRFDREEQEVHDHAVRLERRKANSYQPNQAMALAFGEVL